MFCSHSPSWPRSHSRALAASWSFYERSPQGDLTVNSGIGCSRPSFRASMVTLPTGTRGSTDATSGDQLTNVSVDCGMVQAVREARRATSRMATSGRCRLRSTGALRMVVDCSAELHVSREGQAVPRYRRYRRDHAAEARHAEFDRRHHGSTAVHRLTGAVVA